MAAASSAAAILAIQANARRARQRKSDCEQMEKKGLTETQIYKDNCGQRPVKPMTQGELYAIIAITVVMLMVAFWKLFKD